MTDTLKINLGKAIAVLGLVSTLFTGVWALAGAYNRLAAAEHRADQHEKWISDQTARVERLEDTLHTFSVTLARIDENVKQLRRDRRSE